MLEYEASVRSILPSCRYDTSMELLVARSHLIAYRGNAGILCTTQSHLSNMLADSDANKEAAWSAHRSQLVATRIALLIMARVCSSVTAPCRGRFRRVGDQMYSGRGNLILEACRPPRILAYPLRERAGWHRPARGRTNASEPVLEWGTCGPGVSAETTPPRNVWWSRGVAAVGRCDAGGRRGALSRKSANTRRDGVDIRQLMICQTRCAEIASGYYEPRSLTGLLWRCKHFASASTFARHLGYIGGGRDA